MRRSLALRLRSCWPSGWRSPAARARSGASTRRRRRTPGRLPVRLVSLQPGAPLPKQAASGPYEGNAWAISQGERLYEQYNCVGLPLPRRRRDRAAADGRAVDLRRQRPEHPRHDRRGAPERHALVRRPHPGRPDLDDHRLRAHALRPGAEAGAPDPQRRALPAPLRAGDAAARRRGPQAADAIAPDELGRPPLRRSTPHGIEAGPHRPPLVADVLGLRRPSSCW